MSQPLDDVLSLAERAYVRMQAEQLITHCFEQGDHTAFNSLLHQLVLGGVPSLAILREIVEEIRTTRRTLQEASLEVRQDLQAAFSGFGLPAPQALTGDWPNVFRAICSPELRDELRGSGRALKDEDQVLLDEVCRDAGNRVATIAAQLRLLGSIDRAARDWFSSLAYEAARARSDALPGGDARPQ
jgi:hypothetical protein